MPRYEEQSIQIALVDWFRRQHPVLSPLLTLGSFGENVGVRRMKDLKRMGLTAGYPDLVLYLPKYERIYSDTLTTDTLVYDERWYAALFIEMKAPKGRLSEAQKIIGLALQKLAYKVAVCYSFEEARKVIEDYLQLEGVESLQNA